MRRRAFPYTRPAHLCSALLCMALAACAGTEEAPSNTPAASDAKQKPVAVTTGGDAPVEEPAPEMVAEAEEQVAPQAQPAPKTPALSRAKSEARIAGGAKRDMERARGPRVLKKRKIAGATVANGLIAAQPLEDVDEPSPDMNREAYDKITDNPFKATSVDALSTFSIDVDTASYANTRRFIDRSQMPPKDAVRIEEMVNYFSYDYADPKGEDPFSINTEVSVAPWNPAHRLVHIGLQGKRVDTSELPPSNLVFLLDVSGSMNSPNKLPLLKGAFKLLVNNLRKDDRVAIVVYAGAAGLVLPSTSGAEKGKIFAALDSLRAGGSTAGGAGIQLAYKTAQDHFIEGGNNRIILATDGDFNVGVSSKGGLTRLIEEKRKSGVFLTILGFGSGNYQDAKMEKLSNAGNGNAAYIDSILEAKKVLVNEMGGTLLTIAKDVKIQVEFNPTKVKGHRLIGYENRVLAHQDFNNDKKDAGELGAGHTVTALYEIIPAGSDEVIPGVDELKYQKKAATDAAASNELMTVKLRYKQPDGDKSKLITHPLVDSDTPLAQTTDDFRFSTAVVELGLILRGSQYKGNANYDALIARARKSLGKDPNGYRYDFVKLAEKAATLAGVQPKKVQAIAR